MEIVIAKTAGFCFGVNRAIDTVYENIQQHKARIYTLGPIIHNQQVVDDLYSKGVQAVDSVEDINDVKNSKLIIRTHGVPKTVYQSLESASLDYVDATCPYVQKIQRIVEKYWMQGYQIVIVGDPQHPEVIGINGWCGHSAIVAKNVEDIRDKLNDVDKICVVAQTTINRAMWNEIAQYIRQLKPETNDNMVFFDTICNATNFRQAEAEEIAKEVDIMVVIGGMHSSNTQKLAQICGNYCAHTYHIETADDFLHKYIHDVQLHNKKIGITAGASTPAWIIKEVINKMTEMENLQENNNELSFAEAWEQSMVTLNTGDVVKGTVIGISNNEVYVDLGFKSDGIIPLNQLTSDPSAKPEDVVKLGDEIEVFVTRVNDGEGNVLLSKTKLDLLNGWNAIEAALENKSSLEGKVVQVVNGGVIALISGIKVFVPASQASDKFLQDLNTLLYQNVSLKIIDINNKRKRAVGSIRAVLEQERQKQSEAFWNDVEVGKRYSGTVKKLMDFGAFVDIGGIDGLIHISELSWGKIKHPSEILKEGDIAEVYILDFDKEKKKISLGYKKSEDNPWEIVKSKFNVDDVVKCKVVRLVPFGAFVELIPGVDGLVHISQIANKRIKTPADVLSVGQEVEAKIIEMDLGNHKISLSIKVLLSDEEVAAEEQQEGQTAEQAEEDIPTQYTEDVKITIGDIVNQTTEENKETTEEDKEIEENKEEE